MVQQISVVPDSSISQPLEQVPLQSSTPYSKGRHCSSRHSSIRSRCSTGSRLMAVRSFFVGAHFNGDAHFETSVFWSPVSFRSGIFHAVSFSQTAKGETPQFGSDVDLLGCTYDRIEVYWPSLLRYPNGQSRIHPYNRQPYIELEDVLRKAGHEKDADRVYAEGRRVENDRGWRKVWDRLYCIGANYGIDLWHELGFAIVLFLSIGGWVFSRPGAVAIGESRSPRTIAWYKAIPLAVHQFLPLSLPAKPEWAPSNRVLCRLRGCTILTAATYANFLHILGWILVPLAVAALAGLLRHAGQ